MSKETKGTILYIGGFELPDKNAAAQRVVANAKALRDLNYNVVFIGITKTTEVYKNILDTKEKYFGFDSYATEYPKSKKDWIKFLSSIDDVIKVYKEYEDVKYVIAYNYQALAFKKMIDFCKKNNVKVITDCTEWYGNKGRGAIFAVIKGADTFYRMRILQKQLFGVIAISDYLEQYYSKCKNVVNIPPLVDKSDVKWDINKKEKNDVLTIAYAGSPGDYKDRLDYVIDFFSQLEVDYILNIVGITKEQYLSKKTNVKDVPSNVSFKGRVPHEVALDYVKNADFTCFFKRKNRVNTAGFPTKFVESISSGTPVITNPSSNLEIYFKKSYVGLLIPNDNINNMSLEISNAIITSNKDNIDSDMFDYKNYLNEFKSLLEYKD